MGVIESEWPSNAGSVSLHFIPRVAGAHGNRTHQEPVSRPLTGFEDRAGHQLWAHSRAIRNRDLRGTYQMRSVGHTGYLAGFVPQIGGKCDGTAGEVEAER